ncbi:pseudouridine synthase [Erysipelothrix rhusiopathiae]|uniref:pseudouridine synthase n=1 Tax=Erysipelothrix rhusiopathiae TaxID=1648 RepID=UPI000210B712|nr:pseudouridine synthase [Erysipelothrix rhusiopathiae]AMS11024.1 pseudouridylate synthase [Erysipelothrix rhusiopathiae]AOO67522.1 pseudouridylate synthase [Erysipelothrix rhusiopathiae]AWU41613.1 rRNA pseudouridine synthase [Erysipelothrix rhusiopathiae]MCG4436149.1 rRNA pseudouridine synthase [Erysipelothrix rhusiopathiae]MCG4456750.1 rRNA pseudouridine synthase [Erysipelothrix rhusiopathiae]
MNSLNNIRLQKFIAMSGYCSRRKAEVLINEGKVKVNGIKVTEQGLKVSTEDRVMVNGILINVEEKKVYYILNKPRGIVSSANDDKNRESVVDLVPNDIRVFPVGRLDRETTGALILTNDGDFAYYMTHPKFDLSKIYRVSVRGRLSYEVTNSLKEGITIEGVEYKGVEISRVKYDAAKDKTQFSITLHEGKNRQIRKIFAHFGLPVLKLHRYQIGYLDIDELKIGQYRELKPFEVKKLLLTAKGEI